MYPGHLGAFVAGPALASANLDQLAALRRELRSEKRRPTGLGGSIGRPAGLVSLAGWIAQALFDATGCRPPRLPPANNHTAAHRACAGTSNAKQIHLATTLTRFAYCVIPPPRCSFVLVAADSTAARSIMAYKHDEDKVGAATVSAAPSRQPERAGDPGGASNSNVNTNLPPLRVVHPLCRGSVFPADPQA